jgi:hypothetical protein
VSNTPSTVNVIGVIHYDCARPSAPARHESHAERRLLAALGRLEI